MNKRTLIWGILGCALLALGLTQCDMGVSTSSALTALRRRPRRYVYPRHARSVARPPAGEARVALA